MKGLICFRTFTISLIVFIFSSSATAQERWFEATTGAALSVPSAKGSPWRYQPRVLLHGGVSGFFSLNKTFAVKTGVFYQIKGMTTNASYTPDSVYSSASFESQNTYHFISIPLQLAVTFGRHQDDCYRIAAGMDYNFMVAGYSKIDVTSHDDKNGTLHESLTYKHLISVSPKDDIPGLSHHEGTPLHLFTPAFRLDFTYQWQERLIISAFYEYNLQDVRMRTVDNSKVNLHYTGIALGVRFW